MNNLCGKLALSLYSPTTFDERFIVYGVPFFILDFNLLISESDDFKFGKLY